jgi:hypothetical protein
MQHWQCLSGVLHCRWHLKICASGKGVFVLVDGQRLFIPLGIQEYRHAALQCLTVCCTSRSVRCAASTSWAPSMP